MQFEKRACVHVDYLMALSWMCSKADVPAPFCAPQIHAEIKRNGQTQSSDEKINATLYQNGLVR